MLAKVNSAALFGIDALRVEVEIDLASGLPQLATVGLAEGAVRVEEVTVGGVTSLRTFTTKMSNTPLSVVSKPPTTGKSEESVHPAR